MGRRSGAGRGRGDGVGRILGAAMVAAVVSAWPSGASGQLAWDTPLFVHPHAPHGWSVFLSEPYPGEEVAVVGAWRTAATPVGFGVRVGLGEGADKDLAVFGGADASGLLVRRSDDVPVDVVWVLGGGLSLTGDVLISFPAGVVAGWEFEAEGVRLLPYIGPRVVLDAWIGGKDTGEGDDLQLEGTLDLGLDIVMRGGWVIRFGMTALDREALAVGVTLPAPGRS